MEHWSHFLLINSAGRCCIIAAPRGDTNAVVQVARKRGASNCGRIMMVTTTWLAAGTMSCTLAESPGEKSVAGGRIFVLELESCHGFPVLDVHWHLFGKRRRQQFGHRTSS